MTTPMVGSKSGHIRKNITKMVNPKDIAGNAEEEDVQPFRRAVSFLHNSSIQEDKPNYQKLNKDRIQDHNEMPHYLMLN